MGLVRAAPYHFVLHTSFVQLLHPSYTLAKIFHFNLGSFYVGIDPSVINENMCYSLVASARTWDMAIEALTGGELFAYKVARRANTMDPPENELVQGILPFLRFVIGRDRDALDKIQRMMTKSDRKTSSAEKLNVTRCEAEIELQSETEGLGSGVEPDSWTNWSCAHCRREIGNMHLRCGLCWKANKSDLHYVCSDCFLVGRHRNKTRWPNQDRAHDNKSNKSGALRKYKLQYRLIHGVRAHTLVENCVQQLRANGLRELPQTDKTLRYLEEQVLLEIQRHHIKFP